MLKLYTFLRSPHALKVRLALAELGKAYTPVEVNLGGPGQPREELGEVNPHGKVPVLVDETLVLRESDAILAYLGDAYGGPFWPRDARARAEALQWLFFDAANMSYAGRIWWADVITPRTGRTGPAAPPELVEVVTADVTRALRVVEQHLAGREYLLGRDFSLADCSLGVMVNLLRGTRVDRPAELPRVTAYRERIRARPAWDAAGGGVLHAF